jgi:hypothetical protein
MIFVCKLPINKIKGYLREHLHMSENRTHNVFSDGVPCTSRCQSNYNAIIGTIDPLVCNEISQKSISTNYARFLFVLMVVNTV